MKMEMKRLAFRFRYYLISLSIHLFTLLLLTMVSFQEIRPTPAFQTSVYFESVPVVKKRPDVRRKKSARNGKKPTYVKKTSTGTDRKKSRVKEEELVLPPVRTKPNEVIPYLKSAKRDSDIQKSEELEKLYKKKDSRLPYQRKKQPISPEQRTEKSVDDAEDPAISDENNISGQASVRKSQTQRVGGEVVNSTSIWHKKNDLFAYRNILGKLITANWIVPPVSIKQFQILIEAFIDPHGNLIQLDLLKGSGLAILDAAAERAIRVSIPFPAYPKSFGPEKISFRAVFRFTPERVGYQ